MNPAPSTPKYSFKWAATIVDQVQRKYARATEMVCEVLDITPRDLVKYLAYGDPLWHILRTCIANTDNNIKYYGMRYTPTHLLSIFTGKLKEKRFGNQAERLDKRVKSIILKKQGSRGEGAGGEAEGSQPTPSSPPSGPDVDAFGRKWHQGVLC